MNARQQLLKEIAEIERMLRDIGDPSTADETWRWYMLAQCLVRRRREYAVAFGEGFEAPCPTYEAGYRAEK